jgi:hypothetical protein
VILDVKKGLLGLGKAIKKAEPLLALPVRMEDVDISGSGDPLT